MQLGSVKNNTFRKIVLPTKLNFGHFLGADFVVVRHHILVILFTDN